MSFVRALGESIPRISARNEGRRKIGRGKGMEKNRHAVSLYFPEQRTRKRVVCLSRARTRTREEGTRHNGAQREKEGPHVRRN